MKKNKRYYLGKVAIYYILLILLEIYFCGNSLKREREREKNADFFVNFSIEFICVIHNI